MKRVSQLVTPLALVAAATVGVAAGAQGLGSDERPAKGNWATVIAETAGGHRIGNPEAGLKLVEFMSYTCSHCATFARTGDGAIKSMYVPTGKVSYEIRHLIRDPVDLAASLAVRCGPPANFFRNHEAILSRHPEWMARIKTMTDAQMTRWRTGSFGSRAQAIASDLDFYDIMAGRGYSRAQLDVCLTDGEEAQAIAGRSQSDMAAFGLEGTPSFLIGGKRLDGVHNWAALQPVLDQYLKGPAAR